MIDNSDRFYLDPDNVRKLELVHQPTSHEDVRVSVEYVTGEGAHGPQVLACERA